MIQIIRPVIAFSLLLFLASFLVAQDCNGDGRKDNDRSASARVPNFIIIFCDDMGYADIGPFGAEGYQTPHLDRMASEGMRFTHFYSAQAVCSASRAGLLTGCYPNRIGIW